MKTSTREQAVGRKTAQDKEWITPAMLQKIMIKKKRPKGGPE